MNEVIPSLPTPVIPSTPEAATAQIPYKDPLEEIKKKLTPNEKEEFFKAFLADKPYIEEETLFDGKMKVKFSTLNMHQNNTILLQMQYDQEAGIAKNNDAYLIKIIQYRISASLLEIDGKPFAPEFTEEKGAGKNQTYLVNKLKVMESWPIFKISSLTDVFNRFEKKVRALTEESFKEPF